MRSPTDQAAAYVAKCPPAISGQDGHNSAYSTISLVVNGFALDEHQALSVLRPWNLTCQPPWSEHELLHKIRDAINKPHDKARGHKLSKKYKVGSDYSAPAPVPAKAEPKPVAIKYDLRNSDLPEAVPDGARKLISTLFAEGEGIRIVKAKLNAEKREVPVDGGISLSREQWLKKLDAHDGNPSSIFKSSEGCGVYVAVNPYQVGGTKDEAVSSYRHALVEFDEGLTVEEQFDLYQQMKLPAAAIIYSGGKSVHAWVRIDARDRKEYDERVALLFAHFEAAGFHPDPKNKNPGRLSRLPNCTRFESRQELLYLNPEASFTEWLALTRQKELPKAKGLDYYSKIDLSDKSDVLLGDDWLLKGGSCVISAASGIGKSVVMIQMACHFAVGRPFFGIAAPRPLKTVIIQAENDDRDNARTILSIAAKMEIDSDFTPELWRQLQENVIILDGFTASGDGFVAMVNRIADEHRPDLMGIDPVVAFVGDDITKQVVISKFFREGLQPVATMHKFAWLLMHHFTKPPSDPKSRQGMVSSDYQYRGAGSYDLPGWARATVTITEATDGVFQFRLSKRGGRAGMTHPDGSPTTIAWMRQSTTPDIYWIQIEPPEEKDGKDGEPKEEKPTKPMLVNRAVGPSFFNSIPKDGEGLRPLIRRLTTWMTSKDAKPKMVISKSTAERAIELMLSSEKLKVENELYLKGSNS